MIEISQQSAIMKENVLKGWRHSMHISKKGLALILAVVIVLSVMSPVLLQVSAVVYIRQPSDLNGRDYTGSDRLAALLDQVFEGDIDVYSDNRYAKEVSMPVGTSMSNDTQYYVRSQTTGNPVSGWQCYIYANAVYNKLFREWVGHAEAFAHSRVVIPGGVNTASYELFRSSGVRCGAYLRTTANSDGSYNRSVGHSMIILGYDREGVTYLEGNANGYGLIQVTIRTWDEFNGQQLKNRGRYICHMVQPTDAFYRAQFPECAHDSYEGCGVCTSCGYVFDWKNTLDPWAQGIYRLTQDVVPRLGTPYSVAAAADVTLQKDQKIRTTGQYRNAYDQVWFSTSDASGNTFYVNAAYLKFVEYPELEVTCTGFSPVDGAKLEQQSYPVKGIITANYPLKSISGYLDGELYATWTATDETVNKVDLRQTQLNQKLSFSKLEGGKHTVTLVVRSFAHSHAVTVHESTFYINSPASCVHEYAQIVTQHATCTENGVLNYTCKKCEDTYTRIIAAHGHEYQDGLCIYCGDNEIVTRLSGSVASAGSAEDPIQITLMMGGVEVHSVITFDDYIIDDIQPGAYTVLVTKNGCTPLTMEVTVDAGGSVCNMKICNPGDVNGDHRLNIGDISKLYAHVRGSNKLEDEYAQLCADYNSDGLINIGDAVRLYGALYKK